VHEDDPQPNVGFSFSKEIRLGDLVTLAGILIGFVAWGQKMDLRIDLVEKAQAEQVRTGEKLRADFREATQAIATEVKEQGATIRRVEDKINRARL
jgi:hypothetical protein